MASWVKKIIVVILVLVFLFSTGSILMTMYEYGEIDRNYADAAKQFVQMAEPSANSSGIGHVSDQQNPTGVDPSGEDDEQDNVAPMVVDFDALKAVNPEIVGWIFCEGTVINYPLLQTTDNDTYLNHMYDGTYNKAGAIFVDAFNRPNFQDANTIIYGHNMRSDAMFGTLESWGEQDFYEQHPVFWVVTPEQDYRIDVLGAYETSALSDTYAIFTDVGWELDAYLANVLTHSVIDAHAEPEEGAHYVLLSTCSYSYSNARFVIHGKLVPVDSAGGIPKNS